MITMGNSDETMNNFKTIPAKVEKDGTVHTFSKYLVEGETGRVWSLCSKRYLSQSYATGGYLQCCVRSDQGKQYTTVARFVLAAKLQSWDFDECEHKNKVRDDNREDNLEATTRKEQFDDKTKGNMSIGKTFVKITDEDIAQIRKDYEEWEGKKWHYCKVVAEERHISTRRVSSILSQEDK